MTEQPSQHQTGSMVDTVYDLVVVGGTACGLSVAVSSQRSGLRVRVVEPGTSVVFADLVGREALDVGFDETVTAIDLDTEGQPDSAGLERAGADSPAPASPDDLFAPVVVVTTNRARYHARAVAVTLRDSPPSWSPPTPLPADRDRIHIGSLPDQVDDQDILVVGRTDHAVEFTARLTARGARIVLAAGGMDPKLLSPAGDNMLRRLERERLATILYRGALDAVAVVDGFPVAYFADRHTPDLEFDQVVFAPVRTLADPGVVGLSEAAAASGRVWFHGTEEEAAGRFPTGHGHNMGRLMAKACFPDVELTPEPDDIAARQRLPGVIDELRAEHYNATITQFEPTHSDLWVLRVRPDGGRTSHVPGQYASLGLGFWEQRIDDTVDHDLDSRWFKLIRRSYSISSRIFDEEGYLVSDTGGEELEFYIVLVPPTDGHVPALTPRLALKRPGDRIYLGPKVTGRYTLAPVTDPASTVVFLATGTGEAPHNAMVTELLRKGHYGPIVSAVTVRQWADLGYMDKHRTLEERYHNYHYLPLPTREPDVPKRYIQDLLRGDVFASKIGVELDPARTHVYLCGNPAMIGLPEQDDGELRYPKPEGVIEILVNRGFILNRRDQPGNVHYEEYW